MCGSVLGCGDGGGRCVCVGEGGGQWDGRARVVSRRGIGAARHRQSKVNEGGWVSANERHEGGRRGGANGLLRLQGKRREGSAGRRLRRWTTRRRHEVGGNGEGGRRFRGQRARRSEGSGLTRTARGVEGAGEGLTRGWGSGWTSTRGSAHRTPAWRPTEGCVLAAEGWANEGEGRAGWALSVSEGNGDGRGQW